MILLYENDYVMYNVSFQDNNRGRLRIGTSCASSSVLDSRIVFCCACWNVSLRMYMTIFASPPGRR